MNRSFPTLRGALALAVAALAVGACVQHDDGILVEVDLAHTPGTPGAVPAVGATRTFTTDLGYRVTLTRGYLVTRTVEILPCPATTARRHRPGPSLRAELSAWLAPVGTAWAHDPSSHTLLAVPMVDDVRRPDGEPQAFGTMRPPPDDYCTARVYLGQADRESARLPADVDLVGVTANVSGTYMPPAGGPPVAFEIVARDVMGRDLPVLNDAGVATPLSLSADHELAHLAVEAAYDHWFDGIELENPGVDGGTQRLQENALGTLRAVVR